MAIAGARASFNGKRNSPTNVNSESERAGLRCNLMIHDEMARMPTSSRRVQLSRHAGQPQTKTLNYVTERLRLSMLKTVWVYPRWSPEPRRGQEHWMTHAYFLACLPASSLRAIVNLDSKPRFAASLSLTVQSSAMDEQS